MVRSGRWLTRYSDALVEICGLTVGPGRVYCAFLDCRGLPAIMAKEDGGIEGVASVDIELYIVQKAKRVGLVCKHLRHVVASGESRCHF